MAHTFYIKRRKLHPLLVRLFRFYNREDVVERLNCYGAAILPRLRGYYSFPQPGYLSEAFRKNDFEEELLRTLGDKKRLRYLCLADGNIPIDPEEVRHINNKRRVFTCVRKNFGYHFFFRSQFKYRNKFVWLHKNGKSRIEYGVGTQKIITNIKKAIDDFTDDDLRPKGGIIGYFMLPRKPVYHGQKEPPCYLSRVVAEMAVIFNSYLDERIKRETIDNRTISRADLILEQATQVNPALAGNIEMVLQHMKDHSIEPDLFARVPCLDPCLLFEIKALGLTDHPLMASVMKRLTPIEARVQRAIHNDIKVWARGLVP